MKRGFIVFSIVFLILVVFMLNLSLVCSKSIDGQVEIKELTSYAEEYETGNINYAQFLLYSTSAKTKLTKFLGASDYEGGILKEEQIKGFLGEPDEETKWVWSEYEQKEIRLDNKVPIWRKIIFDGDKIQIRLETYPSLFTYKKWGDSEGSSESDQQREQEISEKEQELKEQGFEQYSGGFLIYRMNFQLEFKQPVEELNFEETVENIKGLAEEYSNDPSDENAEELAKESVNAEKTFENYYKQNSENCEELIDNLLGSENRRSKEDKIIQEFDFFEGENFDVIGHLEMCDKCEWGWIYFDTWLNGRGPDFNFEQKQPQESPTNYQGMQSSEIKQAITDEISSAKNALTNNDFNAYFLSSAKIRALNEAWSQNSKFIWETVNKMYEPQMEQMRNQENSEQYWWIKIEQEKREKVKELSQAEYDNQKSFYENLFKDYEKKEYSFIQQNWEKRLLEEFKEFGQEICNNNQDDNENNEIDCEDSQCGGKICGKKTLLDNGTNSTINLYCIENECKLKEEIIIEKEAVCGNHVCEKGESDFDMNSTNSTININSNNSSNETEPKYCPEDCMKCPEYDAIQCNGKITFTGNDENGCLLEPKCIEINESCSTNDDCSQPLCAKSECIENVCKISELEVCRDKECEEGQTKVQNCQDGSSVILDICSDGIWLSTDVECLSIEPENETKNYSESEDESNENEFDNESSNDSIEINEEETLGDECVVKSDCGQENDVCSNGKCVTLPEKLEEEEEEPEVEEETKEEGKIEEETKEEDSSESDSESSESQKTEESTSGSSEESEETSEPPQDSIVSNVIRSITGFFLKITGFTEESTETSESSSDSGSAENSVSESSSDGTTGTDSGTGTESSDTGSSSQEISQEPSTSSGPQNSDMDDDHEEISQEERCNDECKNRCFDALVRPCANNCIWEKCQQSTDPKCVDSEKTACESNCEKEISTESCVNACQGNCANGEDSDQYFEELRQQNEQNKQEIGVFQAGGSCRTLGKRDEAGIYFDGWGTFDEIRLYKHKYYNGGGQADWCKKDLENYVKQRQEFEKSFNQEFATWFFEQYLPNSADNWDEYASGIYEIYWKDVEISRQIMERAKCVEINSIKQIYPEYKLLNISYSSDFGKFEFWEELKTVELGPGKQVEIISPYMKMWIFPPKSFLKYQMKKSMEKHVFPGSDEESMALTEDDKIEIRKDSGFINKLKNYVKKYPNGLDAAVQLKDFETGEIIFNLYVRVNENDILKMSPMTPEEVPEEDVSLAIDFNKIYDFIYSVNKEEAGTRIEYPPWDKQRTEPIQAIKGFVKNIQLFFKINEIINSIQVEPKSEKTNINNLVRLFLPKIMEGDNKNGNPGQGEENKGDSENIEEIEKTQ